MAKKKRNIKFMIDDPEDYDMYFIARAVSLEKRLSRDRTHLWILGIRE